MLLLGLCWASIAAQPAAAQQLPEGVSVENDGVQLDFNDVEISVVIDTISQLTGKNFIYDDRVRGRVTIVSPTRVPLDEAYAVFESVLQVKGFTTVQGPGGAIKVIPIREAKESNVETQSGRGAAPQSDRFITRLIPLSYIDAEAITNTLKPLVSKDASMVAYPPTNTVILTDSATNISRILQILRSIDVETYKEELVVIKIRHADASTLADHISEIFGAETSTAGAAPARARARTRRNNPQASPTAEVAAKGRVRILTDQRTNSLIILAARQRMTELREVIRTLDVPVSGQGRIHVYYLKHADAEELATTLQSMLSGQPAPATGGGRGQGAPGAVPTQALRAAITELSEGVTVTSDAPTNSLVIQASKEGYQTLKEVIEQLDIPRPQVLVEALIMEVGVSDSQDLGFNGIARIFNGRNTSYTIGSLTDASTRGNTFGFPTNSLPTAGAGAGDGDGDGDGGVGDDTSTVGDVLGQFADSAISGLLASATYNTLEIDPTDGAIVGGSLIQGIITASANVGGVNILSSPYILTSDNEEAEIKIGNNIPIVTSRVQSAAGVDTANTLATSQNIERQDIGITLRVTPQISEGDLLRLKIFQEITNIDETLSAVTGDPQEVGVSLTNRTVENTVVVSDDETVVIGGLLTDNYTDTETKVPWLGDIPILGWAFKTTGKSTQKQNLLIFLTPHIVRTADELQAETIRRREEFQERSAGALDLSRKERKEQEERRLAAEEAGIIFEETAGRNPVRGRLMSHAKRYPVERMLELEKMDQSGRSAAPVDTGLRYGILAATYRDEGAAASTLQELFDAGYDGTLVSGDVSGEVLYEVRVGPFDTEAQASDAAETIGARFGLSPTLTLEREE
ncbi:MAG: type II secretion system secretin GspD [Myxococcota bacterium]|nr:type II secretion system secretin GspD [Myxococcota bacterium]